MGALTPMAYVLWTRFLKHDPAKPKTWPQPRPLHYCCPPGTVPSAALHVACCTSPDMKCRWTKLKQFRQWGSKTPGHPEHWLVPGIETTTGPLGQGFGNGVGMAIAQKYLAAHFNRPGHEIVDYNVYAIAGDGDLMEGVSSEAASLAGHLQLDNLIYFYDDNHISIEGNTGTGVYGRAAEDASLKLYDWFVQKVADWQSIWTPSTAWRFAQGAGGARAAVDSHHTVRTHIAYGSPFNKHRHRRSTRQSAGCGGS